jgi:hypothetical protein
MQDDYEATFQQVSNGNPSTAEGAIQLLKGGNLVKTVYISARGSDTHINQFAHMGLPHLFPGQAKQCLRTCEPTD